MTKEDYEFNYQEPSHLAQGIMQKKVIEEEPFELPNLLYHQNLHTKKPSKTKIGNNNAKACGFSNQKQNIDIATQAAEQECDKTFAEKKRFFEQLSGGHKPKGKVAARVEQINQNGLNSNSESKCKTVNIEEVRQVCDRER